MATESYPSALEITRDNYLAQRNLLEKDLSSLSTEAIDWRGINPSSVLTIGSHVLHIAGFESMARNTVLGNDVTQLPRDNRWGETYQSGFPRELGVDPPSGHSLDYYMDLLSSERSRTLTLLTDAMNGDLDLSEQINFYEVGSELFGEGSKIVPYHPVRLLSRIPIHEDEHRGIINHQRYDYQHVSGS